MPKYTANVCNGSIRSIYLPESDFPQRDVFWSKGIQFGHRSRADADSAVRIQTVYDTTNLLMQRQRCNNDTEYQWVGNADCWVTLLRRGPHVMDGIWVSDNSENFAPDWDFRPDLWDTEFKWANSSGTVTDVDDSPFHDWANATTNAPLSIGVQGLTAYPTGNQYRFNQVVSNIANCSGNVWYLTTKFEGNGDPISRAFVMLAGSLANSTSYRVRRSFLIRQGSALDNTELQRFRNDVSSPATLTFTTGSSKTNAAGDENTDGYNERHGWYELNCSGGVVDVSVDVPTSYTRFGLAFRLWSWSSGNTQLKLDGVNRSPGVDYVIDDVGGGCAVLQLLIDITADTQISIEPFVASARSNLLLMGVS